MKAKYIYTAMLATAMMMGFTACSDDDDVYDPEINVPEAQERPVIKTDVADEVQVGVGETATFNITDGGGDYKVVAENPEFVNATINGNAVTLTGVGKGIAGVVVSDAKGNYKHITVKCMYFQITLDKQEVNVGMKLGHTDGVAKVTVVGGNGNYTAESADETVARVSVKGDVITIQGVKTGETTVTVTDMMGLTQTVNVKVETTTVPFTDEEKAEVLALTENKMVFDGIEPLFANYGNVYEVKQEDGFVTIRAYYKWYPNNAMVMKFKGDLSVGTKTEGSLTNKDWYDTLSYEGMTYEILKNDGSRVWGIVHLAEENYLHVGYFCTSIK